ncbi:MAG: FixH family protein [Pseudomonadota bacterium]
MKELKGYHVLGIALTAFAVIIAANMTMLFAATGSFPGLVVKNSYVASQGWNTRTQAQQALGWVSDIRYGEGYLSVTISGPDGAQINGLDLRATVGRPTTDDHDRSVQLVRDAGSYKALITLEPGAWRVHFTNAEGPAFEKTAELVIPEQD